MRQLQLAVGWVAICALSAAGTYYGMIELDQQMGLQARLSPVQTDPAPSPTPDPKPITPAPQPVHVDNNPNNNLAPKPVDPEPQPLPAPKKDPDPKPVKNDPGPVKHDPPPVKHDPIPTPPEPEPVVIIPQPRPSQDLSGLQSRLQSLMERARDADTFYAQMEQQLRAQGMNMRAEIRSARSAMQQHANAASQALRRRDGATAARALDLLEERVEYLEQSK